MANRSRSGVGTVVLAAFLAALAGGLIARAPIWNTLSPSSGQAAAPVRSLDGAPSLAPLVERTAPAVVNISVLQPSPALQNPLLRDPFFRRRMGVPDAALAPTISAGSGVILESGRGLVITNYHVIENATVIEVGLRDRRSFRAELVGVAPNVDLAVLRIDARDLPALELADSSELAVGDYVVAIGNPFGLGQTVTAGIVSATNRGARTDDATGLIQTDAPINPGNSGGPLIDTQGRVVGINSAIFSPNQGNVGIGFAIPANVVRDILQQAMRT